MINFKDLDCLEEKKYNIWQEADGTIISVGLPSQHDLIKISKLQFIISNLEKDYEKLTKNKKMSEESFDNMENLYNKLLSVFKEMFLFILNLNEAEREFTLDDIKKVPLGMMQNECKAYSSYIEGHLKN